MSRVSLVCGLRHGARRGWRLAAAAAAGWFFPPHCRFLPAKSRSRFLLPICSRQIDESISIADFFPPNRGVDFYCQFLPVKSRSRFLLLPAKLTRRFLLLLPAKLRSRFLLPISSRQIDETISMPISSRQIEESISILHFFPPNCRDGSRVRKWRSYFPTRG